MHSRLPAALVTMAVVLSALPAAAQVPGIGSETLTSQSLLLIASVTVLSLAPGIAIMVTCFPFIVTVLSILRQGIGLQQSPPNMLIISLALFLTWFIMEPVMTEAWRVGVAPLLDGTVDVRTAFERGVEPFRGFMAARLDLDTLQELAALRPVAPEIADPAQAPLSLLMPSFMLSEMSRAFEIGFLLYLPFLVIDLVVSAVLMSMGMMMVPPAVVSLPFKLAFFVMADGWELVSSALGRSYM